LRDENVTDIKDEDILHPSSFRFKEILNGKQKQSILKEN